MIYDGGAQEPGTKHWYELDREDIPLGRCAQPRRYTAQQGAPIWHALCDCMHSSSVAEKLRLCWLESKAFQARSVFCSQAPVICQVSLINDQGILASFAENAFGTLVCLLCVEETLGLFTCQQVIK